MLEHFIVVFEVFLSLCIRSFRFPFFHMHVFRGSSRIFLLVITHMMIYLGGVILCCVLEDDQAV